MTLDEIKASGKDYLVPTDIAPVLGCSPYKITVQARNDPHSLGFPVSVIGTRTKIPRKPFIIFMEGSV